MTVYLIPTSTDPAYTQRTKLDGVEYVLTFEWNERDARWYFSIADEDGEPIASGVKVVADWPLLRRVVDPRCPPGEIGAVDATGAGEPPGRYDLGERVKIYYYDADELEE